MRLPEYSGPFAVGLIDLEIPVRNPRSFGAEFVPHDKINRPLKPSSKRKMKTTSSLAQEANAKAKAAAHQRAVHGGADHDAEDTLKENKESLLDAADEWQHDTAKDVNEGNESSGSAWNPLSAGAKTSVLHLSTVLFTVFYPTDKADRRESDQYSEAAWMGRPKHKAMVSFINYLGQYGPFAMPAAPALLKLLRARIPALVGAPLADPSQDLTRAPPPVDKVETGNFGMNPPRFPLVIFSHGLAGNRLSYSQFCGELASQGVVVCAVEHRDGSGIASIVRTPAPFASQDQHTAEKAVGSGKRKLVGKRVSALRRKTTKLRVPYFAFESVGLRSFAGDPSEQESGLRQAQLAMREAEIRECLYVMRQVCDGNGSNIAKQSTRGLTSKLSQKKPLRRDMRARQAEDESERLGGWKGKIDTSFPTLCGHSFGGATVIEMQRKPDEAESSGRVAQGAAEERAEEAGHSNDGRTHRSPTSARSPFPFAIILDPWVEPIQWQDTSPDQLQSQAQSLHNSTFRPDPRPIEGPAYVINSETFTVWTEHFAKLKRILHDSRELQAEHRGWLMTLCGCQHLDFSDLPLLLPHIFRSTVGPRATISIFCRAAYAQMGLVRQRKRDRESLPGAKSHHIDGLGSSEQSRKQRAKEEIRVEVRKGQASGIGAKVAAPFSERSVGEDEKKEDTLSGGEDHKIETSSRSASDDPTNGTSPSTRTFEPAQNAPSDKTSSTVTRNKSSQASMSSDVRGEKALAAERLWSVKEKRDEREWRKRILHERRKRGLVATMAKRTPSGDFCGQEVVDHLGDRQAEESALAAIDFSDQAADVTKDEDAAKVHQGLQDLVKQLDYKKVKAHSLMAVLFRLKGLHAGLEQPGKVIVHEY